MTNALTYRALAALPAALQALAKQHVEAHPSDGIDDVISEVAVACLELGLAADAERVFARARSRLRRASQDPAHYSVGIDPERHDTAQDDEPTALRHADFVREIAQRQRVSLRRAQQLVKQQVERAQIIGDLFVAEGGAV
jgi:hypothetical protein